MTDTNPFGTPEDSKSATAFQIPDGISDNPYYAPPGLYEARVTDIEQTESKKGDPMWVWHWVIVDAMKGPSETAEAHSKRKGKGGLDMKNYTVLTSSGMFRARQTLQALGLSLDKIKEFQKEDVVNLRAMVEVEDNEYNGQTNSSIKKVMPHPNGPKPGATDSSDPF